jgi:hypothetical protein
MIHCKVTDEKHFSFERLIMIMKLIKITRCNQCLGCIFHRYGLSQPGVAAQPGAVAVQVPPKQPTALPDIDIPGIAQRSLITGIALLIVGFAYFILGCICSAVPSLAAEGIIIGLLNMASGVSGILMKIKLPKLDTIDSLIDYTWVFICCGSVSLATAVGALRFVVARVVLSSAMYDGLARKYGAAAANFALGTAASATTFVFIILVFSIVMLTCSGSIRSRIKVALTSGVVLR